MVRKFKNTLHRFEAKLANFYYRYPSKHISTIGVTGTDGKTTTASLIFNILNEAGFRPAMVTSIGAVINDKKYETGLHTTTPSAFTLQRYIKKAIDSMCDYLVLEVTSHALDQNRVHGIDFKVGVLTNVSHEHMDYHKTYENYLAAKSKLFKLSDKIILNKDDKSYEYIKKEAYGKKVYSYSIKNEADFNLSSIEIKLAHHLSFNIENMLAAISAAKVIGIKESIIEKAIAKYEFPKGRQEIVYDKGFKVIIDFAHTPNSFGKVLSEIKKATQGRLIHVFGSAGGRDRAKRPLMGKISSKYANVIILTAEDPRNEKISDINRQIKLGLSEYKGELHELDNRKDAIKFAVKLAKKGDTVILTGKGHEKSINLGNGELPWSEHKAVEEAIKLNK